MNLYESEEKENINYCKNGKIIIYRLSAVKRKYFVMEHKDLHSSKRRKLSESSRLQQQQQYNRNTVQNTSKSKLTSSNVANIVNSSTNDLIVNMCKDKNPYFSQHKKREDSGIGASFNRYKNDQNASCKNTKTETVNGLKKTKIVKKTETVILSSDSESEEPVENKYIKDFREDIKVSSVKSKKNFEEIVDLTLNNRTSTVSKLTEPVNTIDLTISPYTEKTVGKSCHVVSRRQRRQKKIVEAFIDLTSPKSINLTTPNNVRVLPTRSDSPVFVTEVSSTDTNFQLSRNNVSNALEVNKNLSEQSSSSTHNKTLAPSDDEILMSGDEGTESCLFKLNSVPSKDKNVCSQEKSYKSVVCPLSKSKKNFQNTDNSVKIFPNTSTETNSDSKKIIESVNTSETPDVVYLSSDEDLPEVSVHLSQKKLHHKNVSSITPIEFSIKSHSPTENADIKLNSPKNSISEIHSPANADISLNSPNASVPEIQSPVSYISSDDVCDLPVINISSRSEIKGESTTTTTTDESMSDSDKNTVVNYSSDNDSVSEDEIIPVYEKISSSFQYLESAIEEYTLNSKNVSGEDVGNKILPDFTSESFNLTPITSAAGHEESEVKTERVSTETSRMIDHKRHVTGDVFCSSVSKVLYEDSDLPYLHFNMSYWSECCKTPYNCNSVHQDSEASEVPHGQAKILQFLIEEKEWGNALSFFSYVLDSFTYPSPEILLYILAFIRDTKEMELRNIAGQMFHTFLEYHPPCAPKMKTYYLDVLHSRLSCNDINITADGLFRDILSEIEKCLFTLDDLSRETVTEEQTKNGSEASTCDVIQHLTCRLSQLNFVLKLIVEVLECDMAVWLVKHNFNPKNAIRRFVSRPLIALLFWKFNFGFSVGNFSLISDSKFLIEMYAICMKLNSYPELSSVLSRLLAVIGEVIRSTDFELGNSYPYFGCHSFDFARELALVFLKFSLSSALKMVQNLHLPWLVMLVSHYLISYFIGEENLSPRLETAMQYLNSNPQYFQSYPSAQTVNFNKSRSSINKRDHRGETKLHFACRNNRLDELSTLLSHPDIDVNAKDNFGWTGLHEAICKGNVDCVKYLLNYKPHSGQSSVNLRAKNNDGITPIMYAVIRDQPEICQLLLSEGGSSLLCDKANDGKKATDMIQSESVKEVLNKEFDSKVMWHNELSSNSSSLQFSEFLITFVCAYVGTYRLGNIMCCLKTRNNFEINREGKPNLIFDYVQVRRDIKFLTNLKSYLKKDNVADHVKKIFLLLDEIF